MHRTFEEFKHGDTTSINHFQEKILLLKDRMQTATGRRIAESRHRFVEDYLKEFLDECDGRK
jgi:uncharacterized protein